MSLMWGETKTGWNPGNLSDIVVEAVAVDEHEDGLEADVEHSDKDILL